MSRRFKTALLAAAGIAAVGAGVILSAFNPAKAPFFPRCPSKMLTGYDCPGCGTLRATHSLLHGDIAAAWNYNPAIFGAVALLLLIALAGIHRRPAVARRTGPRILSLSRRAARIVDHPAFPLAIFVAVIIWTVFRNI